MSMSIDESVITLFRGRVEQHIMNRESKSEGLYNYLVDSSAEATYRLFRDGEVSFNDSYFDQFADCEVLLRGELLDGGVWLRVVSIEMVEDSNDNIE